MSEHDDPGKNKPYEAIFMAFEYFKETKDLDELDLGSLINICMAANCPTPEMAQGVIANMVKDGILTFRKDNDDNVFFKPVTPSESDLQ